jgi:sensor histidine kinase YesM
MARLGGRTTLDIADGRCAYARVVGNDQQSAGFSLDSARSVRRAWLRLSLVFWLVLHFILTGVAMLDGWENWFTFGIRCVMTSFGLAMTWLIGKAVERLGTLRFSALATIVVLMAAVIATVHYIISYYLFRLDMKNISPMMLAEAMRGIVGWTECYLAWGALFLAQVFSLRILERERQLSELREQNYGAQMRALRYQINPHFLFNTLNALATLIEEGEARNAERMVLSLSAFLRSTLALDPMQDITLADELDIQARYLEVERERYSDRLTVSFDVPEPLKQARVPSLILQPLVENAVKHGVGALDQAVRILIRADTDRNILSIHVENDAPEHARVSTGTGTGLKNVAQRLATRFGDQASLNSERTAEGVFRATVAMPLRYSAT